MALEIITNFEENLKEMILRGLDINPENPLFEDLNNKDARELMIIDSNFRKRLPVPISREVIISNELISSTEYTRFKPIINIIKNIFEQGQEIKPYLSRGIVNIYTPNNDKDKDLLLNDWGLHHLHLGDVIESDGFIKRTKEVLFCKICENKVYMLSILEHGSGKLPWVEKELLRIIKNNWPELISHCKLNGILRFAHECTENEHYLLRKNHINPGIELDGEFYVSPTCGISCSGHSTMDIMECDKTLRLLKLIKDILNQSKAHILNKIAKEKNDSVEQAIFNLERLIPGEIVLVEEKTNLVIIFLEEKLSIKHMDLILGSTINRVKFKSQIF